MTEYSWTDTITTSCVIQDDQHIERKMVANKVISEFLKDSTSRFKQLKKYSARHTREAIDKAKRCCEVVSRLNFIIVCSPDYKYLQYSGPGKGPAPLLVHPLWQIL